MSPDFRYSVTIPIPNVKTSQIPWFRQFKFLQIEPTMSHKEVRNILIFFTSPCNKELSTHTISSREQVVEQTPERMLLRSLPS